MHNPFGSTFRQASDPYLSLRRLSVLSYSGDLAIRHEVARNLAQRLSTDLSASQIMKIATKFNRAEIVEALKCTTKIAALAKPFVADFIRSLNSLELHAVISDNVGDLDRQITMDIAGHPLTPIPDLLRLLKDPVSVFAGMADQTTGPEKQIYRFPVRDIAASNLKHRVYQLDNETAMKVRMTLQSAVIEEIR